MNTQAITDFLKDMYTTDAGRFDWLLLAASLVALVYAIFLFIMPFTVFRLRSEVSKLRRQISALNENSRTVNGRLYDVEKSMATGFRRVSRALDDVGARLDEPQPQGIEKEASNG